MALVDSQLYQYKPLHTPTSFRVVTLDPSTSLETTLSCSLIHSTLEHYDTSIIDHYTALSYVWGDQTERRIVAIDGKQMSITATLESALRHIRDSKQKITIWADGICIDQESDKEKSSQVKLMGLIYEIAKHTIIYLGEATLGSDDIFSSLTQTSSETTRSTFLQNARSQVRLTEAQGLRVGTPQLRQRAHIDRDVLQRPWFTRVWILQELILSGDPWVQISNVRLRWNSFVSRILATGEKNEERPIPCQILAELQNLRELFIARSTLTAENMHPCQALLKILQLRRGKGVSDPRDMLFAHLGMWQDDAAPADLRALICVNYTKSTEEVYTDIAWYAIRQQSHLGIIAFVETHEPQVRNLKLPSWVPDWGKPLSADDLVRNQSHWPGKPTGLYCASRLTRVSSEPAILECIGRFRGRIESLCDVLPPKDERLLLRERLRAINCIPATDFVDIIYSPPNKFGAVQNIPKNEEKQLIDALDILFSYMSKLVDPNHEPLLQCVKEGNVTAFLKDQVMLELFRACMRFLWTEAPTDRQNLDEFLAGHSFNGLWKYRNMYSPVYKILMGLTGYDETELFIDKKIAVLDTSTWAVVPSWSRFGDEVWNINDTPQAGANLPDEMGFLGIDSDASCVLRAVLGYDNKTGDLDSTEASRKKQEEMKRAWFDLVGDGEIMWKFENKYLARVLKSQKYIREARVLRDEAMRALKNADKHAEQCLDPALGRRLEDLAGRALAAAAIATWSDYDLGGDFSSLTSLGKLEFAFWRQDERDVKHVRILGNAGTSQCHHSSNYRWHQKEFEAPDTGDQAIYYHARDAYNFRIAGEIFDSMWRATDFKLGILALH